ncbi:response regulator [uncultured Jatrophihabitans sp.]|uniref:response regulator n=1 Tax=uncultured Jatrophihabitans sp. TaxID=1610747 RepID=UPI0035CC409C
MESPEAAWSADPSDVSSPTILVVDDDADMRFLARAVLEDSDIVVAGEAASGPEAIEKLRELEAPPVPTVILLDNQMPGPSGLETAERILAVLPEQLIVLFSAFLAPDIVEQAKRIGITTCVSKNEAVNLSSIVLDVIGGRRGP